MATLRFDMHYGHIRIIVNQSSHKKTVLFLCSYQYSNMNDKRLRFFFHFSFTNLMQDHQRYKETLT